MNKRVKTFFVFGFTEQQARGAAQQSHDGRGKEGAEDLDEKETAREAGRVP